MPGKYSGTDPRTKLRSGEPYFFLRAQDVLAPAAVEAYAALLEAASAATPISPTGVDLAKSARDVRQFADRMRKWQSSNRSVVKLPD